MPFSRNIKIALAYDGSAFQGWQAQASGRTVQGVLEEALAKILGGAPRTIAAGRTDAGVHALGQVANVRTDSTIPAETLKRALNALLPEDVVVHAVMDVSAHFHARYLAKSKQYVYIIDASLERSPFLNRYALRVDYPLDIPAMRQAAGSFIGEHDFAAFMAVGSPVKSSVRTVTVSELVMKEGRLYYIIEGSGFLRHMVRNIIGTLLMVGRGGLAPEDISGIIESRDRSKAGPTAPPQGLYLVAVNYEE
ncbi:MAG TPA: tRNA pseudouridine(38-40) synthase TruA [Deltaproteobacteria bacterium]|nr:tRNA pseudouridine(38-40) synthase TruA [Deltaproteobacteria bacterium]